MKKLIILLFIFFSSFLSAQTIVTSLVINTHDLDKNFVIRLDTFYIKSNLIIWHSVEGPIVYYIASYTQLDKNTYIIYCNTNGKLINFTVNFLEGYVVINNKLTFYKSMRL